MRKTILLFVAFSFIFHIQAQYKVSLIVEEKQLPTYDSIFIVGSFNDWRPGEKQYLLTPVDAVHKSIVLNLPAGKCEFKFTHGDWSKVEKDDNCNELQNRTADINSDTVIRITIATWIDNCTVGNLLKILKTQQEDTNRVNTLLLLSRYEYDLKKAVQYANDAKSLSEKINFRKGIGLAYSSIGDKYSFYQKYDEARRAYFAAIDVQKELGENLEAAQAYLSVAYIYDREENYPEGLQSTYMAVKFLERCHDKMGMAAAFSAIGDYESFNVDSEALRYYQLSLKLYSEIGSGEGSWGAAMQSRKIADIYLKQGQYTEALKTNLIALENFNRMSRKTEVAGTLLSIGKIYHNQSDSAATAGDAETSKLKLSEALKKFSEALHLNEEVYNHNGIANACLELAGINIQLKSLIVARGYLERALEIFKAGHDKAGLERSYFELTRLNSMEVNYQKAYEYYKLYVVYKDSSSNEENRRKIMQAKMQYQFDQKEAIVKAEQDKKDAEAKRIKSQQYFAIAALALIILTVVIIASIQYRNSKQKQRANVLLQLQKEKVENTLSELKSTQSQLIQSEKMASLGELTAGIAHEIQNPLNFVNNFSDVNKELADELRQEIDKGNYSDAKSIAKDIRDNEEKINHHGKRADAIVKGMLQHSKSSSGTKEPTDINALCDEYLRLAYHGLRAKDNSFNAKFETEFDSSLPKFNIVPQDMGRVFLNLINNAFYAVNEKAQQQIPGYEPAVIVKTTMNPPSKGRGARIEISVKDNGTGIPESIKEKIFQPFFTTKPTGQGTGLGLSLSYDIVKTHGGELLMDSETGKGSEFIIQLNI